MTAALSTDLRDALLDGTPYRIVIPPGWNGTLLLDLDFVGRPGAPPGPGHLLRMCYVQAPGHCTFTAAETAAALATLEERIDTGRWPATSPEAMNLRANSLDPSATRFIDYDPGPGYRPFYAYSEYPAGLALYA